MAISVPVIFTPEGLSDLGGSVRSAVGGALSSVVGLAAGAGAAIVGTIGGIAVTGGFDRALSIEAAEASLTGLGHSAESIEQIMDNALGAVQGTSFGLGTAAQQAAALVAAGVQQGDELEAVLTTVADTAQISGRSLEDVGTIFGSVAAQGRLMGGDLLQLQSSGVPVLSFLADELGKTQEEVSAMVSAGEIDFATFAAAMEAGLGGAAQAGGETFTGSLANVRAALGRLGETGATPILESLTGAFQNAIPAIDNLTESVGPLIESFSGQFGQTIANVADQLFGFLAGVDFSGITDGISQFSGALGPIAGLAAGALGPLMANLPVIGKLFTGLTGPVGLIIGLFVQIFAESQALRDALGGLFTGLQPAIEALSPVMATLSELVGTLAGAIGDSLAVVINALVPIINQLVVALGPVLQEVLGALSPIITVAAEAVGTLVGALAPLISTLLDVLIPIISSLLDVVTTVFNAIVPVIEGAVQIIAGVIETVVAVIQGDWSGAWEGIRNLTSGVFKTIGSVITGTMKIIGSVIQTGLNTVKSLWNTIWNGVSNLIGGVWSKITSGVRGGVADVVGFVRDIPNKIMNALGNLAQIGLNAGKSIINGIADGIRNAIGAVTSAASSVMSAIRDFLPFSPAKVGPFSGRGWSGYSGESIIKDLAAGMLRSEDTATDDAARVMSGIAAAIGRVQPPSVTVTTPAPSGPPAGTTINLNSYGPETFGGKRREIEWAQKYGTGLRTFQDGALASA